mgnify:CR=1 FL=1
MITKFKIFEAKIKWYSKGSFEEEENIKDNPIENLKVGDRIKMNNLEHWTSGDWINYLGSDRDQYHDITRIISCDMADSLADGKGLKEFGNDIVFKIRGKWGFYRFKD